MTYARATLQGLTSKQRAAWERKAVDILRRAKALMYDEAYQVLDEDHPLLVEMDNLVHMSEDLAEALRPERKSLTNRKNHPTNESPTT